MKGWKGSGNAQSRYLKTDVAYFAARIFLIITGPI